MEANDQKTKEELEFETLDKTIAENNNIRNEMIDVLRPICKDMNIDVNTLSGTAIEARLGVFSSLDAILKSRETARATNLKLIIQNKGEDAQVDMAAKVSSFLENISNSAHTVPVRAASDPVALPEDADALLAAAAKDLPEISDDEIS